MFFFFDVKEKNQKENTAWYFRNPDHRPLTTVENCENKGGIFWFRRSITFFCVGGTIRLYTPKTLHQPS